MKSKIAHGFDPVVLESLAQNAATSVAVRYSNSTGWYVGLLPRVNGHDFDREKGTLKIHLTEAVRFKRNGGDEYCDFTKPLVVVDIDHDVAVVYTYKPSNGAHVEGPLLEHPKVVVPQLLASGLLHMTDESGQTCTLSVRGQDVVAVQRLLQQCR